MNSFVLAVEPSFSHPFLAMRDYHRVLIRVRLVVGIPLAPILFLRIHVIPWKSHVPCVQCLQQSDVVVENMILPIFHVIDPVQAVVNRVGNPYRVEGMFVVSYAMKVHAKYKMNHVSRFVESQKGYVGIHANNPAMRRVCVQGRVNVVYQ